MAEPSGGESGSIGAEPAAPNPLDATNQPVTASVESPAIAPDHEAPPKVDLPKVDLPKVDAPKAEAPKIEISKIDVPKIEATTETSKSEAPLTTGKLMIMSPGDRTWGHRDTGTKEKTSSFTANERPKRRVGAMAAVIVLATVAGAIGGALATTGLNRFMGQAAASSQGANSQQVAGNQTSNQALEASVSRIDADILALKAGLEHTTKASTGQFNKTTDRLEKLEKAQAEPSAKLARLTEAVDKLEKQRVASAAAPVAPAAPAAAKEANKEAAKDVRDVTGSVTPPATTVASAAPGAVAAAPVPAKPEIGRLPTVDGWTLTDVAYGGALIAGRRGTYEVYAGDVVPGLGRIDAIRKQDGRWVVVTSKGLIMAR
jgi:hypothetical protein